MGWGVKEIPIFDSPERATSVSMPMARMPSL
jgi:hypothetical protein